LTRLIEILSRLFDFLTRLIENPSRLSQFSTRLIKSLEVQGKIVRLRFYYNNQNINVIKVGEFEMSGFVTSPKPKLTPTPTNLPIQTFPKTSQKVLLKPNQLV